MPGVHRGQKEDVGSLRLESEGCKPLLMAVHQSQHQPVLLMAGPSLICAGLRVISPVSGQEDNFAESG